MKALDAATLDAALGKWLGKGELRAVLERRDRFQKVIDQMVAVTSLSADSTAAPCC